MTGCAAIIEARMGSTRLPGKVLTALGQGTLLDEVVRRGRAVPSLEKVIVATSTEPADAAIAAHCAEHGIECHRGSESDVLDRVYRAARAVGARHVMRLTADNPLFDPATMQALVTSHVEGGFDYSHCVTVWGSQMPHGAGAEILTMETLEASWREGLEPRHRECIDEFAYEHPERFRIQVVQPAPALQRPELKLSVDTPQDLAAMREIFAQLGREDHLVELGEVIALLDDRPDLRSHFTVKP